MKPVSQLRPEGFTRCTVAPSSCRVSTAQYHPYVASIATSGASPDSRNASARVTGSLSIRVTPTFSPASFSVTTTDRFKCRSMATYCRSTVLLLARERVGFVATSFGLEPPRAGEEPFPLAGATSRDVDPTCSPATFATTGPPTTWAGAEPDVRPTQQERGKRSVIPSLIFSGDLAVFDVADGGFGFP